jgi:DNA-binding response OmpR family regulator
VVIVSMLDQRGKGFALGATDYLVKPVERDEVLEALARCISGETTPAYRARHRRRCARPPPHRGHA